MKKKIIIFNTLITFLSLILFLIVSSVVIIKQNEKETEMELRNYLQIATSIFDGDNYEETYKTINVGKLRLTFIDKEGNVLYDSKKNVEDLDNHIDREELLSLNTVSKRYSNTLNEMMYYIATLSKNVYVRVSIPQHSINEYINSYLIVSCVSFVMIMLISTTCVVYFYKEGFKPLSKQVNKISLIVGKEENYIGDDIEILSDRINEVNSLLNEKIYRIEFETKKLNHILNSLNDAIIIINKSGKVLNCNNKILEIINDKSIINKHIDYIISNKGLVDYLSKTIKGESVNEEEIVLNNKTYLTYVYEFEYDFQEEKAILVSLTDITSIKKLEEAKREFFANSSHELKSPLTSILGYQQMIQTGIINDEEELKEATSKTIFEAQRMKKLISEMLELSRLEAKFEKTKTDCDLQKVVDEILEHYSLDIENKKIKVELNIEQKSIFASMYDLELLVKNIVENAIKYNKQNGLIKITFKNNTLTVKDTGIGIEKHNLEKVFERFYRVDKDESKKNGGTGLGLAIVKHICLNNGYKYNIKSTYLVETEVKIEF